MRLVARTATDLADIRFVSTTDRLRLRAFEHRAQVCPNELHRGNAEFDASRYVMLRGVKGLSSGQLEARAEKETRPRAERDCGWRWLQ